MSELIAQPAFACMKPVPAENPGITVRLLAPVLVSVLARKGRVAEVQKAVRAQFGADLPDAPRHLRIGKVSMLGIGPGRWLFAGAAPEELTMLKGLASLSEQGDGYALFEIWGPALYPVLAKGVALDMETFPDDGAAVTAIAHIGAVLWKSAAERVVIAVFRSYASSFWHWLSASAGEFGLSVEQNE